MASLGVFLGISLPLSDDEKRVVERKFVLQNAVVIGDFATVMQPGVSIKIFFLPLK